MTCFIVNPRSGVGSTLRRWRRLEPLARNLFPEHEVRWTEERGHGRSLAEAAAREGLSPVVAVGGDGTISEVVDGLMQAADGQGQAPVEMGIVPSGTGGDTVRTLGIPRQPEAALRRVHQGEPCQIDVGRLCYTTHSGSGAELFFINVADAGLGGETIRMVESIKQLRGSLAFLVGSLVAMFRHQPRLVSIRCDDEDEVRRVEAGVVAVANGRFFGGGMQISPRSDPSDGHMDLVAIPYRNPLQGLGLLLKVYRGTALEDPLVISRPVQKVHLEVLDGGTVLLDADGEQPGRLPASFEVVPAALSLRL